YPFTVAAAFILAGVGAWVASATYARVHAPVGAMVDPSQLMMNAKDLPAAEFVDYTFVFHLTARGRPMRDLPDLAPNLVKGLFDTYRPELHYMRGPGPKWRAKHERPLRFGPDVAILMPVRPGHARVWLLTSICHAASVILGIALFVIALLFISPTTSK